jgi:molybdopterin synthase catalytic subunit
MNGANPSGSSSYHSLRSTGSQRSDGWYDCGRAPPAPYRALPGRRAPGHYHAAVPQPAPPSTPPGGDDWLGVFTDPLRVGAAYEWSVRPGCGAVVVFSGTVRDHAADNTGAVREGVTHLTYEAYEEQVVPRFAAIVGELRQRWPLTGRVVVWHRLGVLALGESSVLVVVSASHRGEAFDAARFAIDTLKQVAPIWKRESWEEGDDWALGAHPLRDVPTVEARE